MPSEARYEGAVGLGSSVFCVWEYMCVCVCVCVLGASMFVNPQSSNAADAGECRQKPGMKGLLGWEV